MACVTVVTASCSGLTRHAIDHRLARGRWQRPLPGVYLTHNGACLESEAMAAAMQYAGPTGMLSGTYALRRHGVRAAPVSAERMLVLVPLTTSRRSAGFVHLRHTEFMPRYSVRRDGLALAPVSRAVVDTCLGLRAQQSVRAITAEVVQRGLCGVHELAADLRIASRRGSALLRRAVDEVGLGGWSAPECEVGSLLRRGDVPPFEQNADVYDDAGEWLACGDVVWRQLRAILEVDSRQHHADPDAWERTLERHNRLAAAGWVVLHFSPRLIRQAPQDLVAQVRVWLRRRAAELDAPLAW